MLQASDGCSKLVLLVKSLFRSVSLSRNHVANMGNVSGEGV